MNWQKVWEIAFKVVPQAMAAVAAIEAKGGHGSFEIDLAVKDTATGQDVIPDEPVAAITL